jgi:dienelactone hydrolase
MKTIPLLLPTLAALAFSSSAIAEIKHETVDYQQGGTTLEGYLAYDDATSAARPGVLVVHNWMGLTDDTRAIADRLAKLGYVAFAADIYGKGVRPANQQEAGAQAGKYKADRKLLRQRVEAGLKVLRGEKRVDQTRIAAIGYCFGGTTVIELARDGAEIAGVVSFHGGLDSPNPEDGKNIKTKLLILHGANDPTNPPEAVAAFQQELRAAKVDWQMIYYGNAVHAFTDKNAGNDPTKPVAYNEKADRRSWQAMRDFFAEIFGEAQK